MSAWSFDPDTREYVARLLWQHLPAFYRIQDQAPRGEDELREFLAVLGAPLALLRQNIEELHANLFIDTCGPDAIALLAELVGTRTLFPDAETNRRDVRGTIGWRRRKGTPRMLEDMARELADDLVVLQEGWQRLQLAQDLDLLRLERVIPDLRPAIAAETADGPLDRMHHALDPRSISATTGRYHPRHVAFWRHVSETWPVAEGKARYRGNHDEPLSAINLAGVDPDPDWRYTVHPLGRRWALRARAIDDDDRLASDRILPMHFATAPGDYFAAKGRFTIHIASLPAAIAEPEREVRAASDLPAELELAQASVDLRVLERPIERWTRSVEFALCTAVIDPGTLLPGVSTIRSTIEFDGGQIAAPIVHDLGPIAADSAVLIRLRAVTGAGCFCPGGTLAIAGGRAAARLASTDDGLARNGYLRGALIVELPPMWLNGNRWLYLAADGSVIAAQSSGSGAIDVPMIDAGGGERTLELDQLLQPGPTAAWPALRTSQASERITRIPPSPGRGPRVMHGGLVLDPVLPNPILAGTACALEFAAQSTDAGTLLYRPMVRLRWLGSDPASAVWEPLADDGTVVADLDDRFTELAIWRETGPSNLQLAIRFVCASEGARMAPAELAWSAYDGRTTLIYLPEQLALASEAIGEWSSVVAYAAFASVVEPAEDGACWAGAGGLARVAEGQIAPLATELVHQRRRLRWRKLCPWDNESLGNRLAGTPEGFLDVDVEHGLFALAIGEPPQFWPAGPASAPIPPNVTVDFEDAYSDHVGARPASREIEIDQRLPTPTRLVTRSGVLTAGSELLDVPRYASLSAALTDISLSPSDHEVVQFEDDSTYVDETPAWPSGIESLIIQAAEHRRPVIVLDSFAPPGGLVYESLTLRGLAWTGADLVLPTATTITIQWCSVLDPADGIGFALADDGQVDIDHCITGPLTLTGPGTLVIRGSAIDAGIGGTAITAALGRVEIERSTVVGTVSMRVLEASEVVFVDTVVVDDRFHGCIRYSSVPEDCVLPRRHRVVEGLPPRFVSLDRHDPAHLRLSPSTAIEIRQGSEDGGEIGVFHDLQAGLRREALLRRLDESIPVGLLSGLIRLD